MGWLRMGAGCWIVVVAVGVMWGNVVWGCVVCWGVVWYVVVGGGAGWGRWGLHPLRASVHLSWANSPTATPQTISQFPDL
jgi:hypothetical protein